MKIIIGGDLVPTESNLEMFKTGNVEQIIDRKILNTIEESDVRIFNLEAPLYDGNRKLDKCGPNLKIDTKAIKGIKKLNPTILSLSNNHILDYGYGGLKSTLEILDKNDIYHIGAGLTREEVVKSLVIDNVGFYSVCEHEFSCVEDEKYGSNSFDILKIRNELNELRKSCKKVIVLFHGGREEYRYPTPLLQKKCREICAMGANLVICQHSHCIGCYEKYNESVIIYGQGNFIFDLCSTECWLTGLLVRYDTESNNIDYIPFEKKDGKIVQNNKILKDFKTRSEKIKSENVIEEEYNKLIANNLNDYMANIAGYNRYQRKINTILRGKMLKKHYTKYKLLKIKNFIECETHRELLLSCINKMIKDNK